MTPPVVLLTDFGTRDAAVFQLTRAIAAVAPESPIVHLTHEIEPGAIEEGAWTLETNLEFLPGACVVVAVVDPGVGTARRGIVVSAGQRHFVGPDNGLFSGVLAKEVRPAAGEDAQRVVAGAGIEVHELREPRFWRTPNPAPTFHGRDIFGPAAAWLAHGVDVRLVGPPLARVEALPRFEGRAMGADVLAGRVVHVDRFGNLVSTIPVAQAQRPRSARIRGARIEVVGSTYGLSAPGSLLLYADSSGFLAVAVNGGSAAVRLGAQRGDRIEVELA